MVEGINLSEKNWSKGLNPRLVMERNHQTRTILKGSIPNQSFLIRGGGPRLGFFQK